MPTIWREKLGTLLQKLGEDTRYQIPNIICSHSEATLRQAGFEAPKLLTDITTRASTPDSFFGRPDTPEEVRPNRDRERERERERYI